MAIMRVIFHLLWLIPLAVGHYYAAIGFFLLVVVAYIKVMKFKVQLETLAERQGTDSVNYLHYQKIKRRWQAITYLRD